MFTAAQILSGIVRPISHGLLDRVELRRMVGSAYDLLRMMIWEDAAEWIIAEYRKDSNV